jgi:hypothetical protein
MPKSNKKELFSIYLLHIYSGYILIVYIISEYRQGSINETEGGNCHPLFALAAFPKVYNSTEGVFSLLPLIQ